MASVRLVERRFKKLFNGWTAAGAKESAEKVVAVINILKYAQPQNLRRGDWRKLLFSTKKPNRADIQQMAHCNALPVHLYRPAGALIAIYPYPRLPTWAQ